MSAHSIALTVHADPVSWQRPRLLRGRIFMDPKVERRKLMLATHMRLVQKGAPDGASRWRLTATFWCETRRRRDLDRLLSLVLDAATGVVFEDDSQIDEFGKVRKVLGLPKGEGRTELLFERIA